MESDTHEIHLACKILTGAFNAIVLPSIQIDIENILVHPKPWIRKVRTSGGHLLTETKNYPGYMLHLIFFLGVKLFCL